MQCTCCGEPIESLRAAYGMVDEPICMTCHFEMQDESGEDWYGLAPHIHDTSFTGSFIGSTKLISLPVPNEAGWHDLSFMGPSWVGIWYRPDPDAPGMGVYSSDPTMK